MGSRPWPIHGPDCPPAAGLPDYLATTLGGGLVLLWLLSNLSKWTPGKSWALCEFLSCFWSCISVHKNPWTCSHLPSLDFLSVGEWHGVRGARAWVFEEERGVIEEECGMWTFSPLLSTDPWKPRPLHTIYISLGVFANKLWHFKNTCNI